MANTTNSLIANITATEDTTSAVDINRSVGSPSFDSTFASFITYQALINGATTLPLVNSPVYQLYIKNLSTTTSCVVTWTPVGSGAQTITGLGPGDLVILWQKPGGAGTGVSGVTITTASAGGSIEYFFGG